MKKRKRKRVFVEFSFFQHLSYLVAFVKRERNEVKFILFEELESD